MTDKLMCNGEAMNCEETVENDKVVSEGEGGRSSEK
jgi:hypothetical protein